MAKRLFKRGISPIVSTILLIALAVSIGVTIMSFGGYQYGKFRFDDAYCSKILINSFELEKKSQCKGYEFKSLINFYNIDEPIITPTCYEVIATGEGDLCTKSKSILNLTWTPTKSIIK